MNWKVSQKKYSTSAYRVGLPNPSIIVSVRTDLEGNVDFSSYCQAASQLSGIDFSEHVFPEAADFLHDVSEFILAAVFNIQMDAMVPVWQSGQVLDSRETEAELLVPVTPASAAVTTKLIAWFISLLHEKDLTRSRYTRQQDFQKIFAEIRSVALKSTTMWSFLRAAYELNLPYFSLPARAHQIGYGANSRWLDSTFTDTTSVVGSNMAKNKMATVQMLRMNGLPVQPSVTVNNVNDAVHLAGKMGYPVVVKPLDLDRGYGVIAGIKNDKELREAYAKSAEKGRRIMLEKHFSGKDYRLTVFEGELVWAIERQPAQVTGDGVKTVRQLIDQVNASPERGNERRTALTRIEFDDEAKFMLAKQKLTEKSIPKPDQVVTLRRISNVSSGGMPVAVFDDVHPDNSALAIRAVKVLRLDLAGVDLLIPDIRISWKESGAAICEVNSQPGIGTYTDLSVYKKILAKLVKNSGMIPLVLVTGKDADSVAEGLYNNALKAGKSAVAYFNKHISRFDEGQSRSECQFFEAGRQIVSDADCDFGVVALTDDSVLMSGLPFQLFSDLIVTDGEENDSKVISNLKNACNGNVWGADFTLDEICKPRVVRSQ